MYNLNMAKMLSSLLNRLVLNVLLTWRHTISLLGSGKVDFNVKVPRHNNVDVVGLP